MLDDGIVYYAVLCTQYVPFLDSTECSVLILSVGSEFEH
jgi:hypothetical protein